MTVVKNCDSIWFRFCRRAQEQPDAPAVRQAGETTTYQQLLDRAEQIAYWLNSSGVAVQETVAVRMSKSPDLIATLLGILACGASYVPVHTNHPEELVAKLLRTAGCTRMLTDAPAEPFIDPAVQVRQIPDADETADPAPLPGPGYELRALVMYTSGSTGTPKGAELRHKDVLPLVDDPIWDTDHQRRVLSIAPYAFGLSSYEFWVTLLRGNTVILPENRLLDLSYLRGIIDSEDVTAVHLTSGLLRLVADEDPELVRPLREVLTGGDVVQHDTLRRIRAAAPHTWIRVFYGQTETTLFATQYQIAPSDPLPEGRVPIGKPLHGMHARLQTGEPDRPSELWIRGAGVSPGYINDPVRTAERFVQGPDGLRYFKTGDLCTQDQDGNLYFHGREDGMVKVRGYRVELGEVEMALTTLPGVRGAVALATDEDPDDKAVQAFVVVDEGFDQVQARRALATQLPDYAVPTRITVLDQLPVNPNGKVDRLQLQKL